MQAGIYVTVAIFMAGVIYGFGWYASRISEHERRIANIEDHYGSIKDNVARILELFRNGGPH